MDPINLFVAINLFLTISANFSGAKKGLKTSITKVVDKPATFLQKYPPNVSALILLIQILAVFGVGTLDSGVIQNSQAIRIIGLVLFLVFSWLQILSYKTLGKFYSQEVIILKEHEIIQNGIYKFIRHPQYLSQLISDLGAAIALLSYVALPAVLLVEIPLFIARSVIEEKMLAKHFGEKFTNYKKHSGFMIPFIG